MIYKQEDKLKKMISDSEELRKEVKEKSEAIEELGRKVLKLENTKLNFIGLN